MEQIIDRAGIEDTSGDTAGDDKIPGVFAGGEGIVGMGHQILGFQYVQLQSQADGQGVVALGVGTPAEGGGVRSPLAVADGVGLLQNTGSGIKLLVR